MTTIILSSSLSFLPCTDDIAAVLAVSSSSNFLLLSSSSNNNIDISLTRWILSSNESSTSMINGKETTEKKLDFFDPHFHIWDMSKFHDPKILTTFNEMFFKFTLDDLTERIFCFGDDNDDINFKFVGGVHIEAIARNHDGVGEVKWVRDQIEQFRCCNNKSAKSSHDQEEEEEKSDFLFLPSGYLNLAMKDELEKQIMEMKKEVPELCSIRQILNFEPSWPHIQENLLENETWLENFKLLETHGLTRNFEVQINPHQFEAASRNLFSRFPNMTFVVNHLGCLSGKDYFSSSSSASSSFSFFKKRYLKDLQEHVAKHENVFIKLSMMEYAFSTITTSNNDDENSPHHQEQQHWSDSPKIRQLVAEVVRIFGVDRCMIASNFPVSLLPVHPRVLVKRDCSDDDDDVKDTMKQYQESAKVWAKWVTRFLREGIQKREYQEKLLSLNAKKVYLVTKKCG